MKILLIHNHYQDYSPSGENIIFNDEKKLIKDNNIRICSFENSNDGIKTYSLIKKLKIPFEIIWSREAYRVIKSIISHEKAEIAHFHNIFYLISPSAYYACKDSGIPVIQTLHNFRFFCANGMLLRRGKVCEDCVGGYPWRGIMHSCYNNSVLQSVPIVLSECIHRYLGTWWNKVDAYIAQTRFSRRKFIECGIPSEKIFIKPNFLLNAPDPCYSNNGYGVFVGRISKEKGLITLLKACEIINCKKSDFFRVKIVGDGPIANQVRVSARNMNNVEFLGRKSFEECINILRDSRFLIMPSICYENFPLTIREAFACGKAVIASRLGGLKDLVEEGKTGLLFEPANAEDLVSKIEWMLENEDACIEMGKNARAEFEEKYTAEKNFQILMGIYNKVLNKTHE